MINSVILPCKRMVDDCCGFSCACCKCLPSETWLRILGIREISLHCATSCEQRAEQRLFLNFKYVAPVVSTR